MPFSKPNDRIAGYCQAIMYQERLTTETGGDEDIFDADVLTGVQSVGVSRSVDRTVYNDNGRMQNVYGSYGKTVFTINISRVLNKAEDFFYNTTGIEEIEEEKPTYKNSHILATEFDYTLGCEGTQNRLKNYDIILVYGRDKFSNLGVPSDESSGEEDLDPEQIEIETTTYRCCLLTNISYTIPISGPIIEDLTFVTGVYTQNDVLDATELSYLDFPHIDKEEDDGTYTYYEPLTRKDLDIDLCIFPLEVQKAFNVGNTLNGSPILGLQQIEIEIDISYTELADIGIWRGSNLVLPENPATDYELGDRAQQNRYKLVEIPVGISCTFSGVVRRQYLHEVDIEGSEEPSRSHEVTDTYHTAGAYGGEGKQLPPEPDGAGGFTLGYEQYKTDREIKIIAKAGKNENDDDLYLQWHLGDSNYISSFEFTGGDVSGGNVEASISFQNDKSEIFLLKSKDIQVFNPIDDEQKRVIY